MCKLLICIFKYIDFFPDLSVIFAKMAGKEKKSIRIDDCPQDLAKPYPGKQSRNNPSGSVLTKSELINCEVEKWVRHFDDSDLYHNTYFTDKVKYLQMYLKLLCVPYKEAKSKLLEVEARVAKDKEDENFASSQNLLGGDMDVDFGDFSDSENNGREMENNDDGDEISRWEKDKIVRRILSFSDKEIFEGHLEIENFVKETDKFKQRELEYYLAKQDDELFEIFEKLPMYIRRNKKFKQRYTHYVEGYMEDNFATSSSQEILLKLSQTPKAVQSSDVYKERLCHLSFQDRSARLLLKSIKETITELKKTPSGKKQAKLVMAAVSHPVFGDPGLDIDERTRKEVKMMKVNLLKGSTSTLQAVAHEKRSEFPKSVKEIGRRHWIENTIVEPAKHTGSALEEDGETVPTRYQDKTDNECYESFKEDCRDEIKVEMEKAAEKIVRSIKGRPNSEDKQRRLCYSQNLRNRFVINDIPYV